MIKNVPEENIAENFPNLKKETDIQVQEAQRVPIKIKQNRPPSRRIINKSAKVKDKEKILNIAREEQLQGKPHKAIS